LLERGVNGRIFLNKPEVFSRNEKFENVRAVPENNKQNSPGTVKISDLLLWRRSKQSRIVSQLPSSIIRNQVGRKINVFVENCRNPNDKNRRNGHKCHGAKASDKTQDRPVVIFTNNGPTTAGSYIKILLIFILATGGSIIVEIAKLCAAQKMVR
jgi:hypothetical protein